MASSGRWGQAGREVQDEIERFLRRHDAAQNGLVAEHLSALKERGALIGAPLCFGIGRALGLGREGALQAATIVGFAEAAAAALSTLTPEGSDAAAGGAQAQHGLPLALNAADALFALAQVALCELEAGEGADKLHLSATFDAGASALWLASLDTSGKVARYFGDPVKVAGAAGKLAGEVAGNAAGRDAAVAALGRFGELACEALAGFREAPSAIEALDSSGLSANEREALAALVRTEEAGP